MYCFLWVRLLLHKQRNQSIMELITKSLATASTSSPAQGAFNTGRLMDRFSNLQEEMVHHILSFDAMPCAHFTWGRLRLLNYFDRFLIQRGNNHKQRFRICWVFTGHLVGNCDDYFRVITWIHNAARCNVEVLDLDFHSHDDRIIEVELPICLFRCQSLKSLMVDLKFSILKTPSLACSTTLRSLKLKNLTINEEFCKWISCSCKCLKELWLELVHGSHIITIESSSLESLHFSSCYFYYGSQYVGCDILYLSISGEKLEEMHLEWKAVSSNHLINIDAPKLKHFKWFARIQNMMNSLCLEEAVFCLRARVHDIDKVMGILSSIRRVKALVLNDDTSMVHKT